MRPRMVLAVLILLASQLCAAQQQSSATAAAQEIQSANAATSVAAPAAIPSYPDTPKGLEDLINEMLKLQKKGDATALAPYVNSLVLPNADVWFRAAFGNEIGGELADSYDRTQMELPLSFPDSLRELNSKHASHTHAVLFTDSCNLDATPDEYHVLINRTKEQPLYDVRFISSSGGTLIAYFVYVDGAFRYIRNFRMNAPNAVAPVRVEPSDKTEMKTARGTLVPGRLIKAVQPEYPFDARINRIQGKVLLRGVIGPSGNVCSLELIQGDPQLAKAAITAVRKWQYSPYILNGKPVSVDTTITVIFAVRR